MRIRISNKEYRNKNRTNPGLENWKILISNLFRISKFGFRILIFTGLIFILPVMAIGADPPIYSSTNYRLEMLNFGPENVLTSIINSIPPTISSGPSVADISEGAVAKAKITWTTSKVSSSVVIYGATTSYGSHFVNTT